MATTRDSFGCPKCWPADAIAVWEARRGLERRAELVDDSHFHVMILECASCAQSFLSVFTELIDWKAGDDAQHWELLPVTPAEASGLAKRASAATESDLRRLAEGRRSLVRDCPTGGNEATFWSTGLRIPAHE